MPSTCCCVPGCSERGGHLFPKDKQLREKWRIAIDREKWKPTDTSVVCHSHFTDEDYPIINYYGDVSTVRRLKSNVVPTVFMSKTSSGNGLERKQHFQKRRSKQSETKVESKQTSEQVVEITPVEHGSQITVTGKFHTTWDMEINTNDRICKRLSNAYVPDSGNPELAQTKELMLNTLSKSNLKELTLIELLTWMRSLIVVRGGGCVGTEGLYYLAEVEDKTPNAKRALHEVVISKNKVQCKTQKNSMSNSLKINVSYHLQHKQMRPQLILKQRTVPKIVNSSLNCTSVELGKRKRSCETNSTQVNDVNPLPVTLVRVDHSSPNTQLFVFNNSDGTSKDVPNMSEGVPNMNIDIKDKICISTENKAARQDSETEMNQISVPCIKQEPIEASDMKNQVSNSTENKAARHDAEIEVNQISVPCIKQEPIEASDMKASETEMNQISVPYTCIEQKPVEMNPISVPYIKQEPIEASDVKASETEMNQISVPYTCIEQKPVEANDMKDEIYYSTENKAKRCDMETERSRTSAPYIKQEPIKASSCSDKKYPKTEVPHEMDQS